MNGFMEMIGSYFLHENAISRQNTLCFASVLLRDEMDNGDDEEKIKIVRNEGRFFHASDCHAGLVFGLGLSLSYKITLSHKSRLRK